MKNNLTFDTFIKSDCNIFALAGAKVLLNDPKSFMPFWIYGKADTGKSHILNAIYNEFLKDKTKTTIFLRAKDAADKLIDSIHGNKGDWLCIEECDVLIVDNVEFLCGKPTMLKEFTELFIKKTKKEQNVIFASDCPPCELEYMWKELIEGASGSLVADTMPADTKLKKLYAKRYLEEYPFEIDDNALDYIIKKSNSITTLKGALTSLNFYSVNFNKKIDLFMLLNRGG